MDSIQFLNDYGALNTIALTLMKYFYTLLILQIPLKTDFHFIMKIIHNNQLNHVEGKLDLMFRLTD